MIIIQIRNIMTTLFVYADLSCFVYIQIAYFQQGRKRILMSDGSKILQRVSRVTAPLESTDKIS